MRRPNVLRWLSQRRANVPLFWPSAAEPYDLRPCLAHESASNLRADSALCAREPVDVLAVDRLAAGDRRGRCGASAAGVRSAYAWGVAYERISIDPNRMSGLPCIRDTRVTVSAVLGQLAAGLTIPELLVDFPYLNRADVLAALEFAAAAV
jgi:uncharacterized protein (DUF433 family)